MCLTIVAYQIFASMLKQRLLDAGLDRRLWHSQHGFRAKRSTEDAIFVARRHVELAYAQKDGSLSFLALDWRKAFDSVHVDRLLSTLRRFGFPTKYVNVISNIMARRKFFVERTSRPSPLAGRRDLASRRGARSARYCS